MPTDNKKIWEKIPEKTQTEILNSLTEICMEIVYEQEYVYHQLSSQQEGHDLHSSVHHAPSHESQRKSKITIQPKK
jgi:hypothetical protein